MPVFQRWLGPEYRCPDALFEHIHHDDRLRTESELQEWVDLKAGADEQRLKGRPGTTKDEQARVDARIFEFEKMAFRSARI